MTQRIVVTILLARPGESGSGKTTVGEDAISDEFVKQHYSGLLLLLQRRIRDSAVAADMLNEAVATAIEHMRAGRVAEPDRLPGYVYRVALNLYRNHRREFDNRPDLRATDEHVRHLVAANAQGIEALDARLLQDVRTLVEELPKMRDREIVRRFYLDEEDKDAICESLGMSPLHFDKVIFRARQRMRALLEARGLTREDVLSLAVLCVFV